MSITSSAYDLFRFARLRAVADRTPALADPQLYQSKFSRELKLVPRGQRRTRAQLWLDASGVLVVLRGALFEMIHTAVRDVFARPAPITVDTLLTRLDEVGLFEWRGRTAIETFSTQLSDLLLAVLFAPTRTTPPFAEIERVFQAVLLLRTAFGAADERGRNRPAESPDLLALDLNELFSRPIAVPAALAAELDRFSAGIADLLIVKQHIKSYEAGEIAHIENVATGETRNRVHRRLDRSEETFTTEIEREVERESELETTERFELSKETSRTMKEDQQLSFGVNVSAAYGSVQLGSEFEFSRSDSDESSARESTTYAKEVVERSLERIRERVRRTQSLRIIQEVEEQNSHGFKNETGPHVNAIYQFVDKVYEAQVFNYGKREMLDLTIPEPASYLWHRRDQADTDEPVLEAPVKPVALPGDAIKRLLDVDDTTSGAANYERWAARYGAAGIKAPPDRRLTVVDTLAYPSADEEPEPESVKVIELKVPKEYKPVSARVSAIVLSPADDRSDLQKFFYHQLATIGVTLLDRISMYNFEESPSLPAFATPQLVKYLLPNEAPNIDDRTDQIVLFGTDGETEVELDSGMIPGEGGLKLGIFAFNTLKYVVTVKVQCEVTEEALQGWRLATFDILQSSYAQRLLEYQEAQARYDQEVRRRKDEDSTERKVGAPPSRKDEIIRSELKKHCVAVMTEDFFAANDDPPVMQFSEGAPPTFNLVRAHERGAFVRFFEHALEWEHVQFVLYPYFWSGQAKWDRRFDEDDSSYTFRQFMQAGWSRVVVPVRPGFERALHYYLLTGNVWMGSGLPRISDELYVSIADEIRGQTDAGVAMAVPYGTPWQVRVPTSLVYLRRSDDLPRWERVDPSASDDPPDHWRWEIAAGSPSPSEPHDPPG